MKTLTLQIILSATLLLGIQACGSKVYEDAPAADQEAATFTAQEDNTKAEDGTDEAIEAYATDASEAAESTVAGRIFGAEPVVTSEPLKLSEAIDRTSAGAEVIRVRGEVVDVCQKKGCWMMLREGAQEVRVTFKDYGFFVPLDLSGSEVTVEGTLESTVLTEDEARHYAEDAGADPEEIAAIVGEQTEYSFVATSVIVN